MEFQGKTILITGASSGIGRACASAFAREGARLILTGRSRDGLEATARQVTPAESTVIVADLTDSASLVSLTEQVRQRFATLDVLINNAGVGLYAPSYKADPEMVRSMFALNLLAPIELTRRLVPLLPRGGAIVNVSSIAGKVPLPWLTLYSSSKFALNAFSDGLRMELTPAGIHVLCVCPGYVDTAFRRNVLVGEIPETVAGQKRFMITAEQCAEATIEGLKRGKRTVVTPKIGWLLTAVTRLLPGVVFERMGRMNTPLLLDHRANPGDSAGKS